MFNTRLRNNLCTSCVQEQVPGGIFRKVMPIYFLIQPQRPFGRGGPRGRLSLWRGQIKRQNADIRTVRVVTLGCRGGWKGEGRVTTTSGYPGWIQEGPTSCNSRAFPPARGR